MSCVGVYRSMPEKRVVVFHVLYQTLLYVNSKVAAYLIIRSVRRLERTQNIIALRTHTSQTCCDRSAMCMFSDLSSVEWGEERYGDIEILSPYTESCNERNLRLIALCFSGIWNIPLFYHPNLSPDQDNNIFSSKWCILALDAQNIHFCCQRMPLELLDCHKWYCLPLYKDLSRIYFINSHNIQLLPLARSIW